MKNYIQVRLLRIIYWYLHRLSDEEREKFAFGLLASSDREQIGAKLLRDSGSKLCVLSSRITPYLDEITRLCAKEELYIYTSDDVLGSGYFRARRVMTKMKVKYPELRIRDLWKAVDYCSTLVVTGPKETQEDRRLQAHR